MSATVIGAQKIHADMRTGIARITASACFRINQRQRANATGTRAIF